MPNTIHTNPHLTAQLYKTQQPLYDWDFGDPQTLASYILQMKQNFQDANLDIPVSISELAYGWQQAGDTTSVANAVDFFMINNIPYFSQNAAYGNSASSWSNFMSDMNYYKSISQGKPLLVTQVSSSILNLSDHAILTSLSRPAGLATKSYTLPIVRMSSLQSRPNSHIGDSSMAIVRIISNLRTSDGCGALGTTP